MNIIFQDGDFFYTTGGFWESLLVGLITAAIGVISAYALFKRSIKYDKKKKSEIEEEENAALLSYFSEILKNINENDIPKSIKTITNTKKSIVANSSEPIDAKMFFSHETFRLIDNTSSLELFKAYIKKNGISESTIKNFRRIFEIIDTYDYLNKLSFDELKANIKIHADFRNNFILKHIEISNFLYDLTRDTPSSFPDDLKKLVFDFYNLGFVKNKIVDIKFTYENFYGPYRPKFEAFYNYDSIKQLVLNMNMIVHLYIDIVSFATETGTMLDNWVNNLSIVKECLDEDIVI